MAKIKVIEVTYADTPLVCPRPETPAWNAHPKVMLPIECSGSAKCPYCGAEYALKDWDPNHKSH